ncbi:hypothetical protein AGMMS49574_25050 [Bacteroidia bacterium]|nr:hypothetical protein AGMMS49574_25050 [Bacteroidia bacterium]
MPIEKTCKHCGRKFITSNEKDEFCIECMKKMCEFKFGGGSRGDRGGR